MEGKYVLYRKEASSIWAEINALNKLIYANNKLKRQGDTSADARIAILETQVFEYRVQLGELYNKYLKNE